MKLSDSVERDGATANGATANGATANGATANGATAKGAGHMRWLRIALIVIIIASILVMFRTLPLDQAMGGIKQWIGQLGHWGPAALALLYVVATVLMVPGLLLTLVAGAVFGPAIGMVCVSIGSTVGASLAFIIARYFARERMAAFIGRHRRFDVIDRAIGEGGWKVVALLRLSPAIPFNIQNYLYGLTRIRFWPYALTSWIAMIPGTFLYIYLGHITGAALAKDRERTAAEWSMLGVGLLATIAVTVLITRLARRQLKDRVDSTSAIGEQADDSSETSSSHAPKDPSNRSVFLLAVAAILFVAAAAYLWFNAETVNDSIQSRFEPSAALPHNFMATKLG